MFWANLLLAGIAAAIATDLTKSWVQRIQRRREAKLGAIALARIAAIALPGIAAVKPSR